MMTTNSTRRRGLAAKRHMIGGILLLGLLFGGNYLPEILTLLIMVAVTWMAIISMAGLHKAVLVSVAGFVLPLSWLMIMHWKDFRGTDFGMRQSLETSLETTVLCSMVYGAIVWVKAILHSRRAGFDEVVGAFNLYIWIATVFACFYTLIAKASGGAFHLQDPSLLKGGTGGDLVRKNFEEFYYFSFVTQTTVGYGDIVPVSHLARALAVTQAMIGQFYVAVVLTYILNLWIRDLGRHVEHRIVATSDEKPPRNN